MANLLKFPSWVMVGGVNHKYTYSADGRKLKVEQGSDSREYVGSIVYENGSLKRVLIDGGYVENGTYYYYLTDHLGNNRVVASGTGTVLQKNEFYPFGMPMATTSNAQQDKQPYKFGGKEFDRKNGLNLYDFEARQMDPAIGRFTSVDPHAESYYSWSPYHYAGNNPIRITDPTGMDWFVDGRTGNVYFFKGYARIEDLPTGMIELLGLDLSDRYRYENIGGDDLFDVWQIVGGGFAAGGDAAEKFMNEQGYGTADRILETREETRTRYMEVDGGMFRSEPTVRITAETYKTYIKSEEDLYKKKDHHVKDRSGFFTDTKIYPYEYKVPTGGVSILPENKEEEKREKNLERTNKILEGLKIIMSLF